MDFNANPQAHRWMVRARDAPDSPFKRPHAKETHAAHLRALKEDGDGLVYGGIVFDPATNKPTGNVFVLRWSPELADKDAVDAWVRADSYWTQGVWESYEISLLYVLTE